MRFNNPFRNLSKFEWLLWLGSLTVVTLAFLLGGEFYLLTLVTSLIGVTALLFVSKGDVMGQVLTIVFSLGYAVISWKLRYYGEMITYLGMTTPIAAMSVVSWLRHPYEAGKSEVEVARLTGRQLTRMVVLTVLITAVFYYILRYFDTANLAVSTVSIATSFLASYLMFYRSHSYALAYAANDTVLIVLWVLASLRDASYLSMVICFVMFLCNDLYGFVNWRRMMRRQQLPEAA